MKKALILYHSKTGITKRFAGEIAGYLAQKQADTVVKAITEFVPEDLAGTGFVLFGCWTHGLMIFLQHPEKIWVDFARQLPGLGDKKIAVFTTYKLATGSMFRKMKMHIPGGPEKVSLELKSRNGFLSATHKADLDHFIEG